MRAFSRGTRREGKSGNRKRPLQSGWEAEAGMPVEPCFEVI